MIKHFNTAMSAGSSSGGSGKGKGVGTFIVIAGLGLLAYLGYRYITRKSQPVIQTDED